jgi:2-dehydro-3-deoxyphosphogluconate aldolase/(4S)-4-hydroxy-2-oxoglutarate aldolase
MMINPSAEPALERLRLVAVIRTDAAETAVEVGRALLKGGVNAAEITFTVPDAEAAIRSLAAEYPGAVGAGTVLNQAQGERALEAGAAFLVSPSLVPELAPLCREAGALVVLGGLTPSEIVAAIQAQADLVKVFPISSIGGPAYIKSVLEPLPTARLMVSGGVARDQVRTYFELGARSVALGGALTPAALVSSANWAALEGLAREFAALLPDSGRSD